MRPVHVCAPLLCQEGSFSGLSFRHPQSHQGEEKVLLCQHPAPLSRTHPDPDPSALSLCPDESAPPQLSGGFRGWSHMGHLSLRARPVQVAGLGPLQRWVVSSTGPEAGEDRTEGLEVGSSSPSSLRAAWPGPPPWALPQHEQGLLPTHVTSGLPRSTGRFVPLCILG